MIKNLRRLKEIAQAQMDAEGNGDVMIALKWHRPFSEAVVYRHRVRGGFFKIIQTCVEDKNKTKLYGLVGKGKETEQDRKKAYLDQQQRAKEN